ncbi:MAG: metallophosphoesterase [Gammaproteobacteria bacterium]|nr:metallophosphoesterase [Gammaproteobacteria bacterium]
MKLVIIHLSDIHVKSEQDWILQESARIASSIFVAARSADAIVLAVTGDLTFSATTKQFEIVEKFLRSISGAIEAEAKRPVAIVLVPGNHDCTLSAVDELRDIAIEHILKNPTATVSEKLIQTCTSVQQNFRSLEARLTQHAQVVFEDALWREYTLDIGEYKVRLSALNVSWMSRIKEQPGQLAFPIERYEQHLRAECSARIAMLHHPLNWYCQATYHPLRKNILAHSTLLLSGHEHYPSIHVSEDEEQNRCVTLEGGSLQPHGDGGSGQFSVLEIDLSASSVSEQRLQISKSGVSEGVRTTKVLTAAKPYVQAFELTATFEAVLMDCGGRFVHPDKDRITIDDLFVDPYVLDASDDSDDPAMLPAMATLEGAPDRSRLIVFGDEKAGKSTLLLQNFKRLHSAGSVPIYIRALDINTQTDDDILRQVRQQLASQYVDPNAAFSSPRERITFLVDDIDRIRGSKETMGRFLQLVEKHAGRVVATASTGFRFEQLLSSGASTSLKAFDRYELQTYGLELRQQLIRKWCLCGPVSNVFELEKKVHTYADLLNMVIGRNLVPSHPIYLLILLQSAEGGVSSDIQNSGVAHYYQFLITKSLSDAGVRPDELGEHFHYLANLAWLYSSTDQVQVSETDLRQFNRVFSDRFVDVDLSTRLEILCEARIVKRCGNGYSFSYPYAYYFFLGRYLADNLNDASVSAALSNWYKTLHRRESANAVLFLSHHKSDAGVLQELLSILKGCFGGTPHLELNGDVDAINQLVEKSSRFLLPPGKVDENQRRALKAADEDERLSEQADIDEREKAEELDEMAAEVSKATLSFRAANLLGQIVKNNYGSLERSVKQEVIREVFAAPLRMLRVCIDHVTLDPQSMLDEIQRTLRKTMPEIKDDKLERIAKRLVFHFIGMVCSGVIMRAAQMIASDKLLADISRVVDENGSRSFMLAEAAAQVVRPGDLNVSKLTRLAAQLKSNPFAFTLLQSLAAYRIYMYHTSEEEKQQLCSSLDISMARSRQIDMLGKDVKINARRAISSS